MQERYLGDSHDFVKYALLRSLNTSLSCKIGVNWYLTCPTEVDRPGNNDGEKRHHLSDLAWRSIDPDLFDRIVRFRKPANRRLAYVSEFEILPNDTYFYDTPVPIMDRANWFEQSLRNLTEADLIFLDPDNGFEVPSMSKRTSPKYALFEEAAQVARAGKIVVGIQFARQCNPIERAKAVRAQLADISGFSALPVIRGRVAPNILFISLAPIDMHKAVASALSQFASRCHKTDLIA